MRNILLILLLCSSCFTAFGQRKVKVLDIDTSLPISNVSVKVDSCSILKSNYQGIVELPLRFDSVCFSHLQYYKEKLYMAEVQDTIYLTPQENSLPEVTVTGFGPDFLKSLRRTKELNLLQPRTHGFTFDFGYLLDKRGRRDRKHLLRAKKILRDYDLMLK